MWRGQRVEIRTTLSTTQQLYWATEKEEHRRALAATNKEVEEIWPDKRGLGIDQRDLILDEDMRANLKHYFHPHAMWIFWEFPQVLAKVLGAGRWRSSTSCKQG